MEKIYYEYYQDVKEDKISKRTFIWFVVILVFFYSTIFVTNILFQQNYRYITVNGLSMQPTLNANPVYINGKNVQDGVYIRITDKADYGDIIIIDKIEEANHTIIKRLLGKEGDRISIAKLNINGKQEYRFLRVKASDSRVEVLYEDYIEGTCIDNSGNKYQIGYDTWSTISSVQDNSNKYEELFYKTFLWDSENQVTITENVYEYDFTYNNVEYQNVKFYEIEEDHIFYMGDNRTGSSDARLTGTDTESKILGRVVTITHNSTSYRNSFFFWFERTKGYLEIIWKEIIYNFAWKA